MLQINTTSLGMSALEEAPPVPSSSRKKWVNLIFIYLSLGALQKNLLIRWINTLDVCENYLTLENTIEELKSGILLCNILKFHQPNLDFTGVNPKARAKKQCLNNIERALSILY